MKQKRIVILGGGTAGWMTAAALSKFLLPEQFKIELVESDTLGTVGVGEATTPPIRQFNEMLDIDENEFVRATGATYKLAIQFRGWGSKNSSYMHPFGYCGDDLAGINFHHFWLRLEKEGLVEPFGQYSMAVQAAQQGRFEYPCTDFNSVRSNYGYAFHLDATLYARFLRDYATRKGVKRTEGLVEQVRLDPDTGDIAALMLDAGKCVSGDFYIDCSGFRGLLIEDALKAGYENWQRWLPCDRAYAVPSGKAATPLPYTQATAKTAGWQWRIPLQHRTGNGHVYASDFMSDEDAEASLLRDLQEDATAEPRQLRFVTGKRNCSWRKNCVAVGLSAGFLEPLESTSIYLIQIAIQKLLEYFPMHRTWDTERRMFNRHMDLEYERVRDFLILHYHANTRTDSEFWRYCREMRVPDSLSEKISLFKESGQVALYRKGLFMPASWLAVYMGQGVRPNSYDARADTFPLESVREHLKAYKHRLEKAATEMQPHENALAKAQSATRAEYPPATMSLYGAKG